MCNSVISFKTLFFTIILLVYSDFSFSELHNPINKKVLALSQSESLKSTRFKSKNSYKFKNHSFQYKFQNTYLNAKFFNPYLRFNNISLDGKYTSIEGYNKFKRNASSIIVGSELIVIDGLTESKIEGGITSLKGENKNINEDIYQVRGVDGFVIFYNMINMYQYVDNKQSFQLSAEFSLGFNRSFECKNCKIKNETFLNSLRTQLEYRIDDAVCMYGKCYDGIITGAMTGSLINDDNDSDSRFFNELSFVFEKDISNLFKGRKILFGVGYLFNNVGSGASIIISI